MFFVEFKFSWKVPNYRGVKLSSVFFSSYLKPISNVCLKIGVLTIASGVDVHTEQLISEGLAPLEILREPLEQFLQLVNCFTMLISTLSLMLQVKNDKLTCKRTRRHKAALQHSHGCSRPTTVRRILMLVLLLLC